MLGLILDVFQLFISSLYVRLCKVDNVVSEYTGLDYSYAASLGDHGGAERVLKFESKQVAHRSHYYRKWLGTKVRYTYEVRLKEYIGKNIVHVEDRVFPQLCWKFMNRSMYPHLCAINAHMDLYRHWDRAQ